MDKPFLRVGDIVRFARQDWASHTVSFFLGNVVEMGHYGSGIYRVVEAKKDEISGVHQYPQSVRLVDANSGKDFMARDQGNYVNFFWNIWWFIKVS